MDLDWRYAQGRVPYNQSAIYNINLLHIDIFIYSPNTTTLSHLICDTLLTGMEAVPYNFLLHWFCNLYKFK